MSIRKAGKRWPNSGEGVNGSLFKGPVTLTSPGGSIWVITFPAD